MAIVYPVAASWTYPTFFRDEQQIYFLFEDKEEYVQGTGENSTGARDRCMGIE